MTKVRKPSTPAAGTTWSEVGSDHSMTRMLNSLVEGHHDLCAEAGVSPWDFCVMLANVQGLILGGSKDMPTPMCVARIDELRKVAEYRVRELRAPTTSGSSH